MQKEIEKNLVKYNSRTSNKVRRFWKQAICLFNAFFGCDWGGKNVNNSNNNKKKKKKQKKKKTL